MLDDFDFFAGDVEGEIGAVLAVQDTVEDCTSEGVKFACR